MARDRRPYAQIDVGWYMNPKWFQVERYLRDAMPDAMPDALLHALQDAKQLHMTSILYSAQARWDGMFPVEAVKSFARCAHEEAVTALFDVGMWINHPGGMAETRDFLKHQQSAKSLEEASEKARKAAEARWGNAKRNAPSNAKRNAPSNAEKSREEKSREEDKASVQPEVEQEDTPPPPKRPKKARDYTPEFETFWSTYPRRQGKGEAFDSFEAALERTDLETILDGAARHRDDPNRVDQFTPLPATWLNQDRWDDGPLPPRADGRGPSRLQQNMAVVRNMAAKEQARLELEQ